MLMKNICSCILNILYSHTLGAVSLECALVYIYNYGYTGLTRTHFRYLCFLSLHVEDYHYGWGQRLRLTLKNRVHGLCDCTV